MAKKTVQFYLTDVQDKGETIQVFGRTKENGKICILEHFNPYFYALLDEKFDIKKIENKIKKIKIKDDDKIISPSDAVAEERKFLGKKINTIKIILHTKKDLGEIKSVVKEIKGVKMVQETDVPLVQRYLIDKKITPLTLCEGYGDKIRSDFRCDCLKGHVNSLSTETIKPKVLAFDIETYNKGKMPVENVDPILTMAFKGEDFEKIISWTKFETNDKRIEFVKDEKALIEEFKKIIKEYDPDYLIGYFSDGFDFPYIKTRADKLDIKLDINLDNSLVNIRKRLGESKVKLKGIVHIDIFKFIRNIMSGSLQLDSFSLNSVAKELINDEKLPIDASETAEIFDSGTEKDIEDFCLYNLQDAILTFKLFNKIVPNLNEIVKVVGQPIFNICRTHFGQLIEWYLMKRVKEFNEIYPNKPNPYEISSRRRNSYEGGFVLEPEPGVCDNLAVLDFRSVYPSIISAYNICLSTLTDDKKHANESPIINGKRYYFDYKEEGFIPKIIRDLIQRRIRIKEIIKKENKEDPILNARSYSLKILANAFHGYFGFFGARWYNIECASSITAFSRDYIQKTIEKAKEKFNVIYADTDSLFLVLDKKTKEDVINFVKETNRELPSLMELEIEDFYKRGIFVVKKDKSGGAKKKYALLNYEDKMKVKGFETIRRDWSYIAREVQSKVINLILKEGKGDKAAEYIKGIIADINKNKIPMNKMIIQTQLKRNIKDYEQIGPHVAVARRMINHGISVGPGSIIKYIITKGEGMIRDRARLIEEAEHYDSEYYINHQILPAVEKIFEGLGYKKEDLLNEGSQSKLGEF